MLSEEVQVGNEPLLGHNVLSSVVNRGLLRFVLRYQCRQQATENRGQNVLVWDMIINTFLFLISFRVFKVNGVIVGMHTKICYSEVEGRVGIFGASCELTERL